MSLIGVTRRIRHKNNDGTIIEAEIGAYARNVSEDEDHRFVTDKEKNGWNDKVSASGGDISDTKAAEFETSSASFPIPAAGETVKVILGKIKKHLEDLASWRPTVSLIANIVDNCTSTNADKPLSAKQGKVLQDQITQVNSDLQIKIYEQTGSYYTARIYYIPGIIAFVDAELTVSALPGNTILFTIDKPECQARMGIGLFLNNISTGDAYQARTSGSNNNIVCLTSIPAGTYNVSGCYLPVSNVNLQQPI